MNRDAKQNLELDWSDKLDAHNIDDKCGRLKNQSTDIQYYPNSAKFEDKYVNLKNNDVQFSIISLF